MYDCPPDDSSMDVQTASNVQERFLAKGNSIRGHETETRLKHIGEEVPCVSRHLFRALGYLDKGKPECSHENHAASYQFPRCR